jgi:hypothetical protein
VADIEQALAEALRVVGSGPVVDVTRLMTAEDAAAAILAALREVRL